MSGKIVMGYWDCNYCDTKGIEGTIRDCPNCGHPRSENTRFYMNKSSIQYLSEEQSKNKGKGPDWLCEYCGSLNSALESNCTSCGSSKDSSRRDYFDIHEMNQTESVSVEEESTNEYQYDWEEKEPDIVLQEIDKSNEEDVQTNDETIASTELYQPVDKQKEKLSWIDKCMRFLFSEEFANGLKLLAVSGLLFAAIFLMIQLVIPKPETITVTGFAWESYVDVERYETVTENDWTVPSGGRLLYTQEEIHHYDEVFSHYEQETRTYTEQVLSGYDTYYTYSDNGDGTFTEHSHMDPIYTTEIRTETVDVPVYDEVPVYETMYYYEIDKWVYNRTEKVSGVDKTPYYAEVDFASNEREESRHIKYTVFCTVEEEPRIYTCSKELWEIFQIGGTYEVMVTLDIIECFAKDAEIKFTE